MYSYVHTDFWHSVRKQIFTVIMASHTKMLLYILDLFLEEFSKRVPVISQIRLNPLCALQILSCTTPNWMVNLYRENQNTESPCHTKSKQSLPFCHQKLHVRDMNN